MKLTTYNSEIFKRGPLWYSIFAIFFIFFIILLLLSSNYIGVITLSFFLGGYLVFSVSIQEPITIEIQDSYLRIAKKTYARSAMQGFVIEVHKNKEEIKNIVFLMDNNHYIYTIKDTPENIKQFLIELNDRIPLINSYPQTTLQLLMRKLKL